MQSGILLLKLEHYGVRGSALKWFKSYLSNRQQYVTYNGVSSQLKNIYCGVPQRSVLGPLLFCCISLIRQMCVNAQYRCLLPMIQIYGSNINELESLMNSELAESAKWLKVNKLSLNINKTHYMVFTTKRKIMAGVVINIEGHVINEVDSTKLLGIYLDNKLNWKNTLHMCREKLHEALV